MNSRKKILLSALCLLSSVLLATLISRSTSNPQPSATLQTTEAPYRSPLADTYRAAVAASLTANPPVLVHIPLRESEKSLVTAALDDPEFTAWVRDPKSGRPFRNEIMTVRPTKVGDLPQQLANACAAAPCRVVELYNFSLNLLTIAIFNSESRAISIRHLEDIQPEIPAHLTALAYELAAAYPPLQEALGESVQADSFIMGGTKTALAGTTCDRSRTLCVSATHVRNQRAWWVIVNLEDLMVIGMRETSWKDENPHPITETSLRDSAIMEELCARPKPYETGPWSFTYGLTGSDGALVSDLRYNGEPLLRQATNVDWHVSYSGTHGFGYSDAVGCPLFSAAAVVPADLPKWKAVSLPDGTTGTELHQDFLSKLWPMPCNYYYENRLQLFNDGRFRIAVASVGRGCGDNGTYRPVQRLTFPGNQRVYAWRNGTWEGIHHEGVLAAPLHPNRSPEGAFLKVELSSGRALLVTLGEGQFNDGGRGDSPFVYLTKTKTTEGDQDLPTVGPCCNEDDQQGPEKFLNGEEILDQPVTLWYVAQLKNDGRPGQEYCWGRSELVDGKFVRKEFPCIAGPLITPLW